MKKKRQRYTLFLIICMVLGTIMILVGMYFWFVNYDTPVQNNLKPNNEQESTTKDDEISEDDDKYKRTNFDELIKSLKAYNVNYKFNENFPDVINYDFNKNMQVILSENGKVSIKEEGKEEVFISNVSDAKRIEGFDPILFRVYILLNNGDLYLYDLNDFYNGKYTAIKMEGVKNATKFVSINYAIDSHAGADALFGVIDKNNIFIELDGIAY